MKIQVKLNYLERVIKAHDEGRAFPAELYTHLSPRDKIKLYQYKQNKETIVNRQLRNSHKVSLKNTLNL